MHQRETNLVSDGVITQDFVDLDLVVFTQPAGNVHHTRGNIQKEGRAKFSKMSPLRKRFEMVDRLAGLYLNDRLQLPAPSLRKQQKVRKQLRAASPQRHVLFCTGVGANLVTAARFRLQQANDPVVLKLFTDGPYQDRTHQSLQRFVARRFRIPLPDRQSAPR